MAARKQYHHGNLRSDLVAASLALIRKEGLHGFTLREVARRAGVSHNAPYRHFRDKDDLLAAIAEDGFNCLAGRLAEAAAKGSGCLERLRMAGIAYIHFGLERPDEFDVMFSIELDGDAHPAAKAAAHTAFEALLNLLADCKEAGLLRGYEPLTAARIAWAHVHGITELVRQRQFSFKTREELAHFVSTATAAIETGITGPA